MSNATRYFMEGNVLRSHAVVAQRAFDEALALALAGEQPKVVSEAEWRRVAGNAVEPMRKAKVAAYSARRRAAGEEQKRRRAEEREAAKAAKAQAENNGHIPAEATEEDLHDAAAEESLALALADTHEQPGME